MRASAPSWKSPMTLQKKSPTSEAFRSMSKKLLVALVGLKSTIHFSDLSPFLQSSQRILRSFEERISFRFFISEAIYNTLALRRLSRTPARKWPLPLEKKRPQPLRTVTRGKTKSDAYSIDRFLLCNPEFQMGSLNQKALLENARISIPLRKFNLG